MDLLLSDDFVGDFPSARLNFFAIAKMVNDCLCDIVEERVRKPVLGYYSLTSIHVLSSTYVQGLFLKACQGQDEDDKARLYSVLKRRCDGEISEFFWNY